MTNALGTLCLLVLALLSPSADAKTQTVRIEINGPHLTAPLAITDAEMLTRFSIWNGPGVFVNNRSVHLEPSDLEAQGAFIDWPRGTVAVRPPGLQQYEVTFHQSGREPMQEWHRRYVVRYEFDPSSRGGYIYLPGPADGDIYRRNVHSIIHDIEGQWFHATAAWERWIRPLIEKAMADERPKEPS